MKDKRIPTILGAVLLLAILFAAVWVSLRTTTTQSRASGECTPTGVQVTNLTNKSADISFLTSATCGSSLVVNGKTNLNFKTTSNIHYYRIDNLQANTLYQYYIISGGAEHRQPSYNFKTASQTTSTLSTANLAWGKVILASGKASSDTIVYLNIPGAWPLSALTDSNGQWHISLTNSFTDDKTAPFTPPTTGQEDILVYSADGSLTQIENDLSENDPVPDITVGQGIVSQMGTGPGSTVVPTKVSTPIPTAIVLNTKLSIISPTEGESITSIRPDIFGQGKNYSTVNFKIDSTITGTTTTKVDGTWNWSPLTNLSLGKHTLVAVLGTETVSRNFTVASASAGISPLAFSATPSAVTVVPTIVPTAIPTIRTAKVSTKSGMPVTGSSSPLYFLLLSSLLTVSFSLYFFYKDEK